MPARHRAPARARRTWPQRVVLGIGGLLSITLLVGAAGVGWGWWQLNQITRTNVHLSGAAADGEPENWLIVGSDSRAKMGKRAAAGVTGQRSDTLMVLRVDPARRKAKVLSLPRDLWVEVAGTNQSQRINAAFNRGPQALIDTVQQNFQIPINHYLEVDFDGFKSMVDALGGIPVYFSSAARDTMSGLDVEHPGCVNLNGEAALAFARSRHLMYMHNGMWASDGTGDLGRINRQQLLMRKTIDKAMRSGLNVLKIKRLVESGTKNITVDKGVSVSDLLALGKRFRTFDSEGLDSMTVPAEGIRTDAGAAVLRVDDDAARPILAQFRSKDAAGSTTSAPAASTSSVPVIVLNSSGKQGMAANLAGALQTVGFDIVRWGNGSELGEPTLTGSEVHYAPGDKARALLLARHLTEVPKLVEDANLDDGQVAVLIGSRFTTVEPAAKPVKGAVLTSPTPTTPSAPTAPPTTAAPSTTTTTIVGHMPGETPPGVACG
jgi:LCP family protein required for cell wall assembly